MKPNSTDSDNDPLEEPPLARKRPRYIHLSLGNFGFQPHLESHRIAYEEQNIPIVHEEECLFEIVEGDGYRSIYLRRTGSSCLQQGQFSDKYLSVLDSLISEEEYCQNISAINQVLRSNPSMWIIYGPCIPCFIFSILLGLVFIVELSVQSGILHVTLALWLIAIILTIIGFIFYFVKENDLDNLLKGFFKQNPSITWRRGLGRRHEEIEIKIMVQ